MRKSNKRKLEIAGLQTKLHEANRTIAAQNNTISSQDAKLKAGDKQIDSLKSELAAMHAKEVTQAAAKA